MAFKNTKTRLVRVDDKFHTRLKEISKVSNMPITNVTKEIADKELLPSLENFFWKLKRNRKGVVFDIVIGIVSLFVLLMLLSVAVIISKSLVTNTAWIAAANQTAAGNTTLEGLTTINNRGADAWLVMAYFLLHIGALVLGGIIGAQPIFIALNIVVSVFVIIFAGLMSNVIPAIITSFDLATNFPKTLWLMDNMLLLELMWIVLLLIVIYAVRGQRQ